MRRPLFILAGAIACLLLMFVLTRQITALLCREHLTQKVVDDLGWLRMEFGLGDAELAVIRKLHDGYRPQCEKYCAEIASARAELARLLASPSASSAEIQLQLETMARLRARCQAAMLQHFAEVSRAMPPEQGQRYWREMSRLVVNAHERVEESMRGGVSASHGH